MQSSLTEMQFEDHNRKGHCASIIIVTFNHKKYLNRCIESVLKNSPLEIIILDNGSTDGTIEYINASYPSIKLIESKKNLGYGAGNNHAVQIARGKFIVILNPDTYVNSNWLDELLSPISCRGIVSCPLISTYDGSIVNACGNTEHVTGFTFARGLGTSISNPPLPCDKGIGISGCCFAMLREDYMSISGFDETFFIYMEDAELSWRLRLSGFEIILNYRSIVYHDYHLTISPEKMYYLEYGRYIILRKYYTRRMALSLLPSLMMAEILSFGLAFLHGPSGVNKKSKATIDGMFAHINLNVDKRKVALDTKEWEIPIDQLDGYIFGNIIKRFANFVFRINKKIILLK